MAGKNSVNDILNRVYQMLPGRRHNIMMLMIFVVGITSLYRMSETAPRHNKPESNTEVEKLARQVAKLRESLQDDMASLKRDMRVAARETSKPPVSPSEPEREPMETSMVTEMEESRGEEGGVAHHSGLEESTARHFLAIEDLHGVTIREDEPKYLILTPRSKSLTRLPAADLVDQFLSRHSTYYIEAEPETDEDPVMWMLELYASPELEVFRGLDRLQHDKAVADCSKIKHSKYWCSGWHADLWYSARGSLNLALTKDQPVGLVFPDVCKDHDHMFVKSWHYAADACPNKDLSCYFLNFTGCPRPLHFDKEKEQFSLERGYPLEFRDLFSNHEDLKHKRAEKLWDVHNNPSGELYNFLLYSYITRMKYEVRQEVSKRVKAFKLKAPCAVMHVRQNDIAIHDNWRRFFYPLKAYTDRGKDALDAMGIHSILLMTDSAEVLEETKEHKEYEWRWMERPRYKRNGGLKFESQFPSGSPKEETLSLLTLFHLASECRLFIGGVSGFGTLAYRYMCWLHTKNVWDCPPVRVLDQHEAYNGSYANPDPRHNASSEHFGARAVPGVEKMPVPEGGSPGTPVDDSPPT